jgi:type IV secretory pathway VirB10-like protein
LVKSGRNFKFAPKLVEGFLLGYDANTSVYRVFNKSIGLIEVSCDVVFDEINGSQVEQVDLDELDDQEAPCIVLRNMSIRDVCPQVPEEPTPTQDQPSSSIQASPPTQDEEHAQEVEDQVQDNEIPQDDGIDQGEMKLSKTRRMSKRFRLKDHLTQESTKQFNETTSSTPSLVIFKRG